MKSKLNTLIKNKKPILNSFISIPNSFSAEIMANQGYDCLTIDLQHGMIDFSDCLHILQSITSSKVIPICRVTGLDHALISKTLDAGAHGIICPMINNRQDAEQLVLDCKYPPLGVRSFGPTRANYTVSDNYFYTANEEIFCFAMIETEEAFNNIEEIVTTPGLDGIYIGTADLTIGLHKGKLAPAFDRQEPEMIAAKQTLLSITKKHKKISCLHCGTPEYAAKAIGWGFDFVTISNDVRMLSAAAKSNVNKFKSLTNQDTVEKSSNDDQSSY